MTFDRVSTLAASSFAKPLFQHRAVCVVGSEEAAELMKAQGAKSAINVEPASLAIVARDSVDMFFIVAGETDLSNDAWTALLAARTQGAVVVVQASGDAARWSQALSRRFASVERAELVRGDSAWVGPPGAVTATVSVEDASSFASVFVCAERPQRLSLGSVCIGAQTHQPRAASAPASAHSLSDDIAASLDEDRLREVESRLAQTMDDLVQAQLVAAQALAERDALKRKLETGKTAPAASSNDVAVMQAIGQELSAIEGLLKQLRA